MLGKVTGLVAGLVVGLVMSWLVYWLHSGRYRDGVPIYATPRRITSYNVCYTKLLRCVEVPAGGFFRIVSTEGPQAGDLNLFV